jgi:hypothetical protein
MQVEKHDYFMILKARPPPFLLFCIAFLGSPRAKKYAGARVARRSGWSKQRTIIV